MFAMTLISGIGLYAGSSFDFNCDCSWKFIVSLSPKPSKLVNLQGDYRHVTGEYVELGELLLQGMDHI